MQILTVALGTFIRIGFNEVSICDASAIRAVLMSHMNKVVPHFPTQHLGTDL